MWWVWQKFHTQYWIEGTYNITAVHERKDSIVINVAKILLEHAIWKCVYKFFMRKTLNSIVITVAKISPKSSIWKMYTSSSWITQNTGQKLKITAVYENKNSIVINVANILVEDAIWKYLYKMFMKFIQELNCEHCGKYFTKAFNLW